MNIEERIKLISRNCEEIITTEDLKKLLESGKEIQHYIGFEISGLVHLGTGLVSMGKIADFVKAGIKCRIFLADFHSYLNNKLDGNWDEIRWATENYFKEALIASLKCFDVDINQIEFVMGRDYYREHPEQWENLMKVAKHITLSRNLRSISIMGKEQGNDVDMATLIYPPLQVADIFTMGIDLAHAGTDQRKAHVVARDVAKKLDWKSPIAIHHNLIAGLGGPDKGQKDNETLKMSKSKPDSAIFVHDTEEIIKEKIKKAYCPEGIVEFNPIINWVKTLIFWGEDEGDFEIKRDEKFGGNIKYNDFKNFLIDYTEKKIHPMDLKNAMAEWLIKKLEPARVHFDIPKNKQSLARMMAYSPKNP
jgi:tyrosyl-tRNA synthetase